MAVGRPSFSAGLVRFLRSDAAIIAAVCLAACLPYGNSLWSQVTYDDKATVATNPDIIDSTRPYSAMFSNDFWGNPMWGADGSKTWSHKSYRPLTVLTMRLDHDIWGTDGPNFGYHFTNTLIHVISCALVTVAVLHEFGPRRRLLAAVASLVFALHPVHVEVVANITSRAETLSSVWMIGSVVCYMWATDEAASRQAGASADAASLKRQWGWTVASLLLVVIGVLCKETSIVTPALLVAYDFCRASDDDVSTSGQRRSERTVAGAARCVGARIMRTLRLPRVWVLAAFTVALLWFRVFFIAGGYSFEHAAFNNPIAVIDSWYTRTLSFMYIQSYALSMLVIPVGLTHEHLPIEPVYSVTDPRMLHVVALWSVLLSVLYATLVSLQGHKHQRAATFGVVFLIVPFLPASHAVFKVAFLAAERTLYLPSVGAAVIFADLLGVVAGLDGDTALAAACDVQATPAPSSSHLHSATPPPTPKRATGGGGDGKRTPRSSPVPEALLARRTPPSGAVPLTRASITVLVVAGAVCILFAIVVYKQNEMWFGEQSMTRQNLRLKPLNSMTLYGKAWENMYMGHNRKAAVFLSRSAKATPGFARAWLGLGAMYLREGHWLAGMQAYLNAANAKSNVEFLSNLFTICQGAMGHVEQAQAACRRLNLTQHRVEYLALLAANNAVLGISAPRHYAQAMNNAACVRMVSPQYRFGGEEMLDQADLVLASARRHHAHPAFAIDNMARLNAVRGQLGHALAIASFLEQQVASLPTDNDVPTVEEARQLVAQLRRHVDGNTTVDGPTHTRLTRLGIPCAIRNLNFFQP